MDQSEKDRREKERKEKLKTEVLELGPVTKSLLKKIEKDKDEYDDLTISLLLRHSELNIQKMREYKGLINDINFFDYLHELEEKVDELNNSNHDNIENFSSELAELLIHFQSVVLGAELLTKSNKDVLIEQSNNTKQHLKQLKSTIAKELNEDNSLSALILCLRQFISMSENIKGTDELHDLEDYPLPISFEEGHYLHELILEIENDTDGFIKAVDNKVDELLSVFKGGGESIIDQVEGIFSKNSEELTADDLNFLVRNSSKEVMIIAKDKIEKVLNKLRNALDNNKKTIKGITEDSQVYNRTLKNITRQIDSMFENFETKIGEDVFNKLLKDQSESIDNARNKNFAKSFVGSFGSLIAGFLILSAIGANIILMFLLIMIVPFSVMIYFLNRGNKEVIAEVKKFKSMIISEIEEIDRKISTIKINMK